MEQYIDVHREIEGIYQLVGQLDFNEGSLRFAYDETYLEDSSARALSPSLPLKKEVFGAKTTRAYFDGLLPEGEPRRAIADAAHVGHDDVINLIKRLNNESAGALIFAEHSIDPSTTREYEPLDFSELAAFGHHPRAKALELNMASRLSLAGAQAKIGLYHKGNDLRENWFIPKGSAPSTHILKASDGTFSNQSINEALCLKTMEFLASIPHL